MKKPIRVAVTGAAGNIGYALLFRLGCGSCFGDDQPIELTLLEIPPAMKALEGVVMEVRDAAFPLVHSIDIFDDPKKAFEGVQQAFLVGSRPRGPGMERADLIQANGPIFVDQGRALNEGAANDVRVLVVGNPCNTNALIAMNSAPDIPDDRFSAMTRLDENRARAQLSARAGTTVCRVARMVVWGNHSTSMVPDFAHATIDGKPVVEVVGDEGWLKGEFVATVGKRGAAIIEARGSSSAASAASAAVDHMRTLWCGSAEGEMHSMGVVSPGAYGAPEGLIFSFPVECAGGDWKIVEGLEHDEWMTEKLAVTASELLSEREAVADLL